MFKLPKSKNEKTIQVITVKDWINAVKSGTIKFNKKNRGRQGVVKSYVSKIVNEYDVHSLESMIVTYSGQLVDGHTRTTALLELFDEGKISSKDIIAVNIVPNSWKFKVYKNVNDGRAHTVNNKITNDDYLVGKIVKRLENKIGVTEKCPNLKVMLDILYAMNNNILINCKGLQLSRSNWNKLVNMSNKSNSFKITNKSLNELTDAYNYCVELKSSIKNSLPNKGLLKRSANKMLNSPGFLMLVLTDYLQYQTFTTKSINKVTKAILSNKQNVVERVKLIPTRSEGEKAFTSISYAINREV